MDKIFSLKTILATLVSTTMVSGLAALPVRANEAINFDRDIYTYSDRFDDNSTTDNLNKIVGITGLLVGTGAIGWYLTKTYKPSLVNSLPAPSNNTSLLASINPKLRRELLTLVHDRQTANRLLSGTLTSHPGRSANWLAEKVIYDLKRDR